MGRKIALIGSAPSSARLAPFRDKSWSIWGCSPGVYPVIAQERVFEPHDAFFELHRWQPPVVGRAEQQVPWFSPEYCQWLRELPCTVYTGEHVAEIKNSVRLPREMLLERYGPYFFTSSLAWMMALALEQPDIEEIGLWGVDMSATEEYRYQRPGCHFFIQHALQRGVRVTIPPESDLLQPMPLYGVGEWDAMMVKYTVRQTELVARRNNVQANLQNMQHELAFLNGAIDNHGYWMNTWIGTANIPGLFAPAPPPAPVAFDPPPLLVPDHYA